MSRKAAVLGAAGGIGQPLSLLMKQNQHLTELALFDVVPVVKGVAADLSHINTPSVVTGYTKDDEGMQKALKGCFLVVIPAGVPRKPGMTRDDLFKINGGICKGIAEGIAENCPDAFVLVISNPVNSTVPIFAEVFKKAGTFDPKKLFGVTTLDIVRASTFVTEVLDIPNEAPKYAIPVVGGHSGKTIVPLLSQSEPKIDEKLLGDKAKVDALINRIQFGGDEVVKAKDGAGSATLSMAYAGYRFAESLIQAKFGGKSGIIEDSYIHISAPGADSALSSLLDSESAKGIDFFSLPVELGANGIQKVLPIKSVNDYEKGLLKECVEELKGSIVKGQGFITGQA